MPYCLLLNFNTNGSFNLSILRRRCAECAYYSWKFFNFIIVIMYFLHYDFVNQFIPIIEKI